MREENTKKTPGKTPSSTQKRKNRASEVDNKEVQSPAPAKQVPFKNSNAQQPVSNRLTNLQSETVKSHSKKWSHYLFDFIMLFLAVTAGFFVDNKREVYMEQHRANEFSKQLLADLRLDSLLFENRNKDIQSLQAGFDNLLSLLTKNAAASSKEVLETLLPLAYVFDLPATTTTYNQMKSSGALRYIVNQELTAHLQDYYDVLLPRSMNIAKISLDYYAQNINPFYLKHMRTQDYDSFNDTLLNKDPVITGRTKQIDQELANIMGGYRSLLKIQVITMNNPALGKIKEAIQLLKDEYNLD